MIIIFSAITLFYVWCVNAVPMFSDFVGECEVYSKFSSSQATINKVENENYFTQFFRRGEAVVLPKSYLKITCHNPERLSKDELEFVLGDFLDQFNAKLVMLERLEHGVSCYAYSQDIKYSTNIKGKKINLHVFIGETVKIGSPIIYGSY